MASLDHTRPSRALFFICAAIGCWCVGEPPTAEHFPPQARADSAELSPQPDRLEAIKRAKVHLRKWAAGIGRIDSDAVETRPMPGKATWKYSELDSGPLFALEALVFFSFTSGRTGSVNPFRHVLLTTTDYSRAELKSERARPR